MTLFEFEDFLEKNKLGNLKLVKTSNGEVIEIHTVSLLDLEDDDGKCFKALCFE